MSELSENWPLFADFEDEGVSLEPEEETARVLLVDDDPLVTNAIRRVLLGKYIVTEATSGSDALAAVDGSQPFAVVVSDLRMPGMDGVAFLRAMHERHPDTVRILLTGHADLTAAIAAVNEAKVSRFLTKPSPNEIAAQVIADGVEQYRLARAESELLEGTLQGSVGVLMSTLSIGNPVAFARAARMKHWATQMLEELQPVNSWEIEVAVMLSQLGAVTLPPAVTAKMSLGASLDETEQKMAGRLPGIAQKMLAGIPRLGGVRSIIASQYGWQDPQAPLGSKLLHMASEYDVLTLNHLTADEIAERFIADAPSYGDEVMSALQAVLDTRVRLRRVEKLPVIALEAGMILAADVFAADGTLLVPSGLKVTVSALERIANFARSSGLESKTVPVLLSDTV